MEKKVFCLVKWAKTNAFVFPIGKMKLIKMLNLFQPIEFSLSKKASLLEVNLYGISIDVGRIIFYLVRFRPWDPAQTLDLSKKTPHFFLQCEAKIVRRHTS